MPVTLDLLLGHTLKNLYELCARRFGPAVRSRLEEPVRTVRSSLWTRRWATQADESLTIGLGPSMPTLHWYVLSVTYCLFCLWHLEQGPSRISLTRQVSVGCVSDAAFRLQRFTEEGPPQDELW